MTPLPKRWGSSEFQEAVATSKAWQRIYPVLIGVVATISIAAVTQSCYVSYASGGIESDLRHVEQSLQAHGSDLAELRRADATTIEEMRRADTDSTTTTTATQSQILIQLGRMEARMDTQFADVGRRIGQIESAVRR